MNNNKFTIAMMFVMLPISSVAAFWFPATSTTPTFPQLAISDPEVMTILTAVAVVVADWFSVKEAAAAINVSRKLIAGAIRRGELKCARISIRNVRRIHRTWLTEWLERSSQPHELRPVRRQAVRK